MADRRFRLEAIIRAVDQATGPIRQIGMAAQRVSRATGLDRVAGAAAGSGRALVGVGRAARAAIAPVAAVAGAAGLLVRGLAHAGDDVAKTAQRVGLGVVELQRWRHAAELTGTSTQVADMAIQRFGRRAAEAAAGTGEAHDALAHLGIQLTDSAGRMRSTDALLHDVADALQGIEDPLVRNRIAMRLFDTEGVQFGVTLSHGSEAARRMGDEAERLGVITEAEARAAERWTDGMTRLGRVLRHVGHAVAGELLPHLEPLVVDLRELAIEARPRVLEWMRESVRQLGVAITWLRETWAEWTGRLGAGWRVLLVVAPVLGTLAGAVARVTQALGTSRIVMLGVVGLIGGRLLWSVVVLAASLARLAGAVAMVAVRLAVLGVRAGPAAVRAARWLYREWGLLGTRLGLLGLRLRALGAGLGLAARRMGALALAAGRAGAGALVGLGRALVAVIAKTWAWTAALLANPVVAVATVIVAALVGAVYLIYRHWDGIVEWWSGLWDGIEARWDALVVWLGDALGALDAWWQGVDLAAAGAAWIDGLRAGVAERWDALVVWLGEALGALDAWWQGVDLAAAGAAWIDGLRAGVAERWDALVAWLGDALGALDAWWQGVDLAAAGAAWIDGLWDGVEARWDALVAWLGEALGALDAWWQGVDLAAAGAAWIDGLRTGVAERWDALVAWLGEALGALDAWWQGVDLAAAGAAWIDGLWDGVEARWDALVAWLGEAVSSLLEWLPDWVRDRMGLDGPGGVLAAPDRPGAESVLDGRGSRTQVGGEVRIRIEGAPPGTRIDRVRTDNPDVPIDVEAGYPMAGTA